MRALCQLERLAQQAKNGAAMQKYWMVVGLVAIFGLVAAQSCIWMFYKFRPRRTSVVKKSRNWKSKGDCVKKWA
jgi:hypothetical protein